MANTKKDLLIEIYNKYKNIAIEAYKTQEYEFALGLTSAVANYMYNCNLIYTDDELEDELIESSVDYIKFDERGFVPDKKNVLFYDEFGLDTRGLCMIYLKAIIENGFNVIYVTKDYSKERIPTIKSLIKDSGGKVFYIERDTYKRETESLLEIIKAFNAGAVFVYDLPQGIIGTLASNALKKTNAITYKINLTDHAFWLGAKANNYVIDFRDFGASLSKYYRNISEDRIIKLPYRPDINKDIEFQGFPFEADGKKVIFSGGSLYKTFDEKNTYYNIVRKILTRHEDVVFWYAGEGDSLHIQELINEFPKRVYFTPERKDLYQIMRHCYFYLSTYPISGGLMGQYAACAEKIPMTLLYDDESKLLINNANELCCEYRDVDKFLKQIDKIIDEPEYLFKIQKHTINQVISWKDFSGSLKNLLDVQNTMYKIEILEVDIENFQKIYIDRFDVTSAMDFMYTKRTKDRLQDISGID